MNIIITEKYVISKSIFLIEFYKFRSKKSLTSVYNFYY